MQNRWNEFCRNYEHEALDARGKTVRRAAPIPFIAAGGLGVMAYIFSGVTFAMCLHAAIVTF